ncbi:hypothetical protein CVV38_03015 [Candidatus Peregrinibacteria bacterium HGW-Peregrinibacteria-1]|jgi:hypothetical protein|nr:MAG: hypothetical protein CVV38_03015 [Candidatus Peregrinibacteria bacterium HGW-Peregrinibacteria-1]
MKSFKTILLGLIILIQAALPTFAAQLIESELTAPPNENAELETNFLEAVINMEDTVELDKSVILDASQSFIPNQEEATYTWDFGDGNKDQGIEALHVYKEPGHYTVSLTITNGEASETVSKEIFVYTQLKVLLSDQPQAQKFIQIYQNLAQEQGIYLKVIDSFGSSTEFISEEVLSKKLIVESSTLKKANIIIVWTKENAGLNAISRYIRNDEGNNSLSDKNLIVITNNISTATTRIQRQFSLIQPQSIVVTREGAERPLIQSLNIDDLIQELDENGYVYELITEKTGRLQVWNFMSYLVNLLVSNGIPDNTIALLILLPVIATIIAFMKQVVGINTYGIYTPSIITLSFLVIGVYAGLLTLAISILVAALSRPLLERIHMLFIPKMAIVITLVSLTLTFTISASIYLGFFSGSFLSIAIFPMLILSTLVEKFVSTKGSKGLLSAATLMLSTVVVAIIAYLLTGGEINFGPLGIIKFNFIKNIFIAFPETVFLLVFVNLLLGKWTGLRIVERMRFKEVLRHIEE